MQCFIDYISQTRLLFPFCLLPSSKLWSFFSIIPGYMYEKMQGRKIDNYWNYADFLYWTEYKIKHNGQTIAIEKVLNDLYSPANSGIYLEDYEDVLPQTYIYLNIETPQTPQLYLFLNNESFPQQTHIFSSEEYSQVPDFIVWIPQTDYNNIINYQSLNEFKENINIRKIAGKKYIIQTY